MNCHSSEAVIIKTAWHHGDISSPEADSRVSNNLYVIFNKQGGSSWSEEEGLFNKKALKLHSLEKII